MMQPTGGDKQREDVTGTVVMATLQKMPNQTRSRAAASSPGGLPRGVGAEGQRGGTAGVLSGPSPCLGGRALLERGCRPLGAAGRPPSPFERKHGPQHPQEAHL